MSNTNTAKRLARNTMYMYIRMFLLMFISFYTSRVVLKQLGVDDYGVYNLVGSLVAMFSSLRGLFSSSTQRFLNYEMGRGNDTQLKTIFSMSININLMLSAIFVILVEIVGLWYLNSKIVIEPERLFAAHRVFQISVFTSVISIMTTPYDAVIIAHERMDFYAYMSVFEGILKLIIVFLLSISPIDKLVFYSVLLLIVSLLVRMINTLYCKRSFSEANYVLCWDKSYFKEMASFAGWNFLGNTSYTLSQNGLNMILNFFGGPSINASRGLTYQVSSSLQQFVSNVVVVIKPFCVKSYGEGNNNKMMDTLFLMAKAVFIIQLCISVPFLFFTDYILQIWLGQVPNYSVVFLQLLLLNSIIRSLASVIDILFQSTGYLKLYQICEGIILALPVPFSFVALKLGAPFYSVFIFVVVFEIINQIVCCLIAQRVANLKLLSYLKSVVFPCFICLAIAVVFFIINKFFQLSIVSRTLMSLFLIIIEIVVMFRMGLRQNERLLIIGLINAKERKNISC